MDPTPASGASRVSSLARFFSDRWHGEVPPPVLFWRDMLSVGSIVNLTVGILSLMMAAQGAPMAWVVAVHFAPLPYNLFLVAALMRAPNRTKAMALVACLWLIAVTVV